MVTELKVTFDHDDFIVIEWFEHLNWERLDIPKAHLKEAKLKIIELAMKMG